MTEKKLTHIDESGKATMVDVGHKPDMHREATASGHIKLSQETLELIRDNGLKKGDVLTTAELAGIQAAKRTSDLIPLCHNLLINKVTVVAKPDSSGVHVVATVRCTGKTGVEMEALTAVSIALLTVYDMCKAVDKHMIISEITLNKKTKQEVTS